jgi:hypothetical protein
MTRLFTASSIIAICGFAMVCGWNVVAFSRARVGLASHEAAAGSLRPWIGFPGLTVAAIDASLAHGAAATNAINVKERGQQLDALLAVKPLSPDDWVALAGVWVVAGEPYKRVLAALDMSRLTGPNEGGIMWERGIFGLLQWDFLPPKARSGTIRDIARPLADGIVTGYGLKIAERVLSAKSEDARAQILRLLRDENVSSAQLARLGL